MQQISWGYLLTTNAISTIPMVLTVHAVTISMYVSIQQRNEASVPSWKLASTYIVVINVIYLGAFRANLKSTNTYKLIPIPVDVNTRGDQILVYVLQNISTFYTLKSVDTTNTDLKNSDRLRKK